MNTLHFFSNLIGTLLALSVTAAASLVHADEGHDALGRPSAATWCADHCDAVITDWSLTAFQVIKAADGYADPMAASRSHEISPGLYTMNSADRRRSTLAG